MVEFFKDYEIDYRIERGYPGNWNTPDDKPEVIILSILKGGRPVSTNDFDNIADDFIRSIDIQQAIENEYYITHR